VNCERKLSHFSHNGRVSVFCIRFGLVNNRVLNITRYIRKVILKRCNHLYVQYGCIQGATRERCKVTEFAEATETAC